MPSDSADLSSSNRKGNAMSLYPKAVADRARIFARHHVQLLGRGVTALDRASGSGRNVQLAISPRGGGIGERWRKRGCHVFAAASLVTLMSGLFMDLVPMCAQCEEILEG